MTLDQGPAPQALSSEATPGCIVGHGVPARLEGEGRVRGAACSSEQTIRKLEHTEAGLRGAATERATHRSIGVTEQIYCWRQTGRAAW